MSGDTGLERGYRRLLACYPRRFRDDHGEELLAVLLASARDGQQRPGLAERADLVRSGLGMRLRPDNSATARQGWSDALAAYSVAGPVLLLLITVTTAVLQVVVAVHPAAMLAWVWPGLCLMLAVEAVIIAPVLAGLRKTALAALVPAAAAPWLVAAWVPGVIWGALPSGITGLGVLVLEVTALIVSPGPRHGRRLVHWGHWALILTAVAAAEISTLMVSRGHGLLAALVVMAILVLALNRLGRALRLSRYFLLLAAATFYPTAFMVAAADLGGRLANDLGNLGTAGLLLVLFAGPLLCAAVAAGSAIRPRRRRII